MRTDGRRLRVALTLALLTLGAAAPSTASAFSAATMFSEPGDYIGGGVERIFHSGNASISVSGTDAGLTVKVSGGTRGDAYNMSFAPPSGETFEVGRHYTGAQRTPFREAGRPGIDISGSGRGCNKQAGSFQVTDLETDADTGAVVRLALLYEQHCEGGVAALFGEVRYGYTAPVGPAAVPTHVRWPAAEREDPSSVQPVTLVAWKAPVEVGSAELAGPDADAFTIRADECSGKTILPGESCQVFVRFEASSAGLKHGALHLVHGGGITEVELDGYARGGRTRFLMDSDEGDYIGGGRSYAYTPANATIAVNGSRRYVRVSVDGDDGSWWDADFEVGEGDILSAGRTYENATRYPFNNDGHGLSVGGSGRGCNRLTGSFTVHEATFDDNGALQSLSLTYVQHCEGGEPALRGTVDWRAGDSAPPEPDYDGGADDGGAGWTPPPDDDAAPGAPPYDAATAPTLVAPPAARRTAAPRAEAEPSTTAESAALAAAPAACEPLLDAVVPARGATRRADRLRATRGDDLVLAGAGSDRIWARSGDDCVDGAAGRDRLRGGPGDDVLVGGRARDRLLGGPGDDVLVGGPGRDVLRCGRGRDVARVGRGDRTKGCERVIRTRRANRRT